MEGKHRRAKGDGSIQELIKGKKYKVQLTIGYDANGKQIRKSYTGSTRQECIEMLNKYKSQAFQGTLVTANISTFAAFIKRWFEIKSTSLRPKTIDTYQMALTNHLPPFFGHLKLQKITTAQVNTYFVKKTAEGMAATTRKTHRALLSNIFSLAVNEGLLGRNPIIGVNRIKSEFNEMNTLTCFEIPKVLKAAKGHTPIYFIILLALATGMRRGELLALTWDKINFTENTISIQESMAEIKGKPVLSAPKTNNSRRIISVDPQILLELRDYLWTPDEGLVFQIRGQPIPFSTFGRHFRECLRDAGITRRIRPHDLRHTHVTQLLANGYDAKMIAARIGDDVRTVITTYAHALPEKDKDAAIFIGSMMRG